MNRCSIASVQPADQVPGQALNAALTGAHGPGKGGGGGFGRGGAGGGPPPPPTALTADAAADVAGREGVAAVSCILACLLAVPQVALQGWSGGRRRGSRQGRDEQSVRQQAAELEGRPGDAPRRRPRPPTLPSTPSLTCFSQLPSSSATAATRTRRMTRQARAASEVVPSVRTPAHSVNQVTANSSDRFDSRSSPTCSQNTFALREGRRRGGGGGWTEGRMSGWVLGRGGGGRAAGQGAARGWLWTGVVQ